MPQTSDAMKDLMNKWFPNDDEFGHDQHAIEFLKSHGYTLTRDWRWQKPTKHHTVSVYEYACIRYLVEEWDFGWIIGGAEPLLVQERVDPAVCVCELSGKPHIIYGGKCCELCNPQENWMEPNLETFEEIFRHLEFNGQSPATRKEPPKSSKNKSDA